MRFVHWLILAVSGGVVVVCGCSDAGKDQTPPAGEVFVSIPPQATFVETIAGGRVRVRCLLEPGDSPATYSPPMKQMVALDGARLYLRIGVPFENALAGRIDTSDGRPRVVDVTRGIEKRMMRSAGGHGDDHDHAHHGAPDPHVWLSPRRVKRIATNIAEALIAVDEEHAETYRSNLRRFRAELDALDDELSETLAPLAGEKMYVYHPAFGYLAADYGLEQVPVEIEGKEPSYKRIVALAEQACRDGVRVVFVQPQFSDSAARALADAIAQRCRRQGRNVSIAVVPLDPLARDYVANMRRMANTLRAKLSGEGAPTP
ncbi:MAG: zinc ABC transporter substrate-binding protein [Phycisphaerae bacterium]|nr:zinc ABC transporter substrate-binding protein [Phycisphaerae bacterium]